MKTNTLILITGGAVIVTIIIMLVITTQSPAPAVKTAAPAAAPLVSLQI